MLERPNLLIDPFTIRLLIIEVIIYHAFPTLTRLGIDDRICWILLQEGLISPLAIKTSAGYRYQDYREKNEDEESRYSHAPAIAH